jgi:hypothetical protein
MKKILLFGAALAVASIAMSDSSYAQQRDSCECVNGVKCVWVNGVLECDPNITCEGSFVVTPPIPPAPQPVNSTATPTDISASAVIPSLGQVQISLDQLQPPPPPAPPTIIRSNNPGARFPLTVEISFNAIAEVPGVGVFRSVGPLTYSTTNATSVGPFINEKLTLQNSVTFSSATGQTFVLDAGSSSIVLGQHQGGPDGR